MNSWFIAKVKYTKQMDDGQLKRVTEPYLFDAVSWTNAETRIYEELGSMIRGEFLIKDISRFDVNDIFKYDDTDDICIAKVEYISVDADSGKEKKVKNTFLVYAHDVKTAYERIKESLSDMMVSFNIVDVKESPIVDIYPYNGEREVVQDYIEEIEDKNPEEVFSAPSETVEG